MRSAARSASGSSLQMSRTCSTGTACQGPRPGSRGPAGGGDPRSDSTGTPPSSDDGAPASAVGAFGGLGASCPSPTADPRPGSLDAAITGAGCPSAACPPAACPAYAACSTGAISSAPAVPVALEPVDTTGLGGSVTGLGGRSAGAPAPNARAVEGALSIRPLAGPLLCAASQPSPVSARHSTLQHALWVNPIIANLQMPGAGPVARAQGLAWEPGYPEPARLSGH